MRFRRRSGQSALSLASEINPSFEVTATIAPLEQELEVIGHPVAHLWLTAKAPDLDLFVYLEEVDTQGKNGLALL